MTNTRSFKQRLSKVLRLWDDKQHDNAFAEVEDMLHSWPGNAQLYILWASLVQLQEEPTHSLDEAKKALQQSLEFEKDSPAGAIELGHFLDAVEDNPQAASKAFADGIRTARRLLIDGLLGQARALLQLDKRKEASRCLMEALSLAGREGVTYAWIDDVLRSLGFSVRVTKQPNAKLYEHETGAIIAFPMVQDDAKVIPRHLLAVRAVLNAYGIADSTDLVLQLQGNGKS